MSPGNRLYAALSAPVRWLRSTAVPMHPNPIFVLGNQKSGTTVVAALLAKLTGLSVTLDLEREAAEPTYHRIRPGGGGFAGFVRRNRRDFSRDIVKDGVLSLYYEELAGLFPKARFVMVMRDPRDNVRSILNRLGLPGNLRDLEAGAWDRLTPAWKLILDGRWLGLSAGNYVGMLAERWNLISDAYLAHADRMRLIRYEDFLKDKSGAIMGLASALSLVPRNDISAELDVQYQPKGNRGVSWEDFFGARNLEAIETLCRGRMEPLGYSLNAKAAA